MRNEILHWGYLDITGYLDILNTCVLNADAEEVGAVFCPVQEELHYYSYYLIFEEGWKENQYFFYS